MKENYKPFITVLLLATLCIFFGRAFQFIFWDAPYRELFWDSRIALPIVENIFGMQWHDYATSPKVNNIIDFIIKSNGYLLLLAGLSTIVFYFYPGKFLKIPIYIGVVIIVFLILLEFKQKFTHIPQLLEGLIQVFVPMVFLWAVRGSVPQKNIILVLKLAIGLTFLGHGLYAINLYATPGNFIDMCIVILRVTEDTAKIILYVAGVLDILLLPLFFMPKVQKYAVLYAIVWGTLTAFARVTFTVTLAGFGSPALYTFYETIYRLPHGLAPLALYFLINKKHYILKPKLL